MFASRSARSAGTLGQTLFPQQTLLRHAVLVAGAALFIAAAAQISIKIAIGPVPISAQPFAVLLVGALLGPRLGAAAAVLYVSMGIVGLPVFALGKSGWAIFTGSTGGYLMSYPFVAALVGYLAERGWDRRPLTLAAAMLLGNVVIYAFGLPWLWMWAENHKSLMSVTEVHASDVLKWGLIPFIPGDLAKLLLAAGLVPSGWQLLRALRVGPARVLSSATAPVGQHMLPAAVGAALVMAIAALLPWDGRDLGVTQPAGLVVLAAGILGAAGALLRMRGVIGAGVAQLWGFAAASAGGLAAFIRLVRFEAGGTMELADVSLGVPLAVVAALALLAFTASEASAGDPTFERASRA